MTTKVHLFFHQVGIFTLFCYFCRQEKGYRAMNRWIRRKRNSHGCRVPMISSSCGMYCADSRLTMPIPSYTSFTRQLRPHVPMLGFMVRRCIVYYLE